MRILDNAVVISVNIFALTVTQNSIGRIAQLGGYRGLVIGGFTPTSDYTWNNIVLSLVTIDITSYLGYWRKYHYR